MNGQFLKLACSFVTTVCVIVGQEDKERKLRTTSRSGCYKLIRDECFFTGHQ